MKYYLMLKKKNEKLFLKVHENCLLNFLYYVTSHKEYSSDTDIGNMYVHQHLSTIHNYLHRIKTPKYE